MEVHFAMIWGNYEADQTINCIQSVSSLEK